MTTNFGLSKLTGNQWTNYPSAMGEYLWQLQGVKVDLNDTWVCNSSGQVFKFDLNAKWSQIPLPQYSILSMYSAMNGIK